MNYVPLQTLTQLRVGDTIRSRSGGMSYVVVSHYGTRVTAVRVQDVTNPPEWEVLREYQED